MTRENFTDPLRMLCGSHVPSHPIAVVSFSSRGEKYTVPLLFWTSLAKNSCLRPRYVAEKILYALRQLLQKYLTISLVRYSLVALRELESRLDGRWFNSRPPRPEIGDRLRAGKPPQYFTKPPRATQPPTLSWTGNEYQSKCSDALRLGVKRQV